MSNKQKSDKGGDLESLLRASKNPEKVHSGEMSIAAEPERVGESARADPAPKAANAKAGVKTAPPIRTKKRPKRKSQPKRQPPKARPEKRPLSESFHLEYENNNRKNVSVGLPQKDLDFLQELGNELYNSGCKNARPNLSLTTRVCVEFVRRRYADDFEELQEIILDQIEERRKRFIRYPPREE